METVGGPQIRFLLNDLLMQASDMDRHGSSSGDIPKPALVNSLFIAAYQQRGRGLRIKGHSRGWTGGGSRTTRVWFNMSTPAASCVPCGDQKSLVTQWTQVCFSLILTSSDMLYMS